MTQEEKITNHIVSLETAKKLKAAGWEKETLYYFEEHKFLKTVIVRRFDERDKENCERLHDFSAPLATELLEELPKVIKHNGKIIGALSFNFDHNEQKYWVSYGYTNKLPIARIFRDNLHEALAEMWIMLKEYNLIKTTP